MRLINPQPAASEMSMTPTLPEGRQLDEGASYRPKPQPQERNPGPGEEGRRGRRLRERVAGRRRGGEEEKIGERVGPLAPAPVSRPPWHPLRGASKLRMRASSSPAPRARYGRTRMRLATRVRGLGGRARAAPGPAQRRRLPPGATAGSVLHAGPRRTGGQGGAGGRRRAQGRACHGLPGPREGERGARGARPDLVRRLERG